MENKTIGDVRAEGSGLPDELSDAELKALWMDNYRSAPWLLAEEMAKWPTRDLVALRADMKDAYHQFLDEDQQWQKDQQDSVDGL
jgi:hypothetical protein